MDQAADLSIPDFYQKPLLFYPGKPDEPVANDTVLDLENHHGPARFSTQSPGSQAG